MIRPSRAVPPTRTWLYGWWIWLLVSTACVAAGSATPTAAAGRTGHQLPELTIERPVTLWGWNETPAAAIEVLFDGRSQPPVLLPASEPDPGDSSREWRLVLYVDPALSTPADLASRLQALAERAVELVSLGTVEIVVSDPYAEWVLAPTAGAAEVRAALAELGQLTGRDSDPQDPARPEALAERRLELRRWLLGAKPQTRLDPRPRCLLLLADRLTAAEAGDGGAAGDVPPTDRLDELAATLAAEDWTVTPLAWTRDGGGPTSSRRAALDRLATPTGGEVIDGLAVLDRTLARLQRLVRLTLRLSGAPDGIPKPLELLVPGVGDELRVPRWATISTPRGVLEMRALRALEKPHLGAGELEVEAVLRPDAAGGGAAGEGGALVEALTVAADVGSAPLFGVTLLVARVDGPPESLHELVELANTEPVDAWIYRRRLSLSEELVGGAVVVEELRSGRWGAAALEFSEQPLHDPGRRVAMWSSPGDQATAAPPPTMGQDTVVIRLLPPRRRAVRGKTRFETLVSSPAIRKVEFRVDEAPVVTDDDPPFTATLDLGPEASPHTIEVVALAADGTEMGSDRILINSALESFQVRIEDISGPDSGMLTVSAEVQIPSAARLDRVEFYRNRTLLETRSRAPFRVRLPAGDAASGDLVRVVAYLEDGSWIDDAQLLAPTALAERVEVNLVELHVMVSDDQAQPVRDLRAEDFRVTLGGRDQRIESLGEADRVPLLLGVVIDTSESMWPLMPDTQKAGAQFIASTLDEGDRAFLVDFDTRPRLAHDTTADALSLLRTFSRLTADGFTALYDAVIFSMLQFEEAAGRKALVLLTDGDDYRSRYGPRRCIEYGRRLGVPVYIISLAGLQGSRRNLRRLDLEGITAGTGGRVFYIREVAELAEAYASINRELRSQYLLTFSTDRPLAADQLDNVEVRVAGRGLSVRSVIAGQELR